MLKKNVHTVYNIAQRHKVILGNFSYISLLQLFLIILPLLTYPYLIRVLGAEVYGWVILAQVLASYCSIVVDFGFNTVSARHISINRSNRDKLSEILSSILTIRFILWFCCLLVYIAIIFFSNYREHLWLFLFSYGVTINELLFPQFYYQGVEKMKYITLLNIVIRSVFTLLIFVCIKDASDYLLVPILMCIGYLIGGALSLYIIFCKEKIYYYIPSYSVLKYYLKDASAVFFTDIITTVKDKLNYILLGSCVAVNQIVVYDLGSKITALLTKPANILCTVLLPKMAKERNIRLFKLTFIGVFVSIAFLVLFINIFLPEIVHFFIAEEIDLLPIRIYSIAPLFLGLSILIAVNLIVAFGYNKYLLYSIYFTTGVYLFLLTIMYYNGLLNSVLSFVIITVISYLSELVFRILISIKIIKAEK